MWNPFKKKEIELPKSGKDGDEPWVDIKGVVDDPHKGIQIELDWNDAFVRYLRDNGLNAANDEAIVQLWLAMLHQDMLGEFTKGKNFE